MSELNTVTRSHQPPAQQRPPQCRPSACAGSWALKAGHATTLRPQQAGEFRVTHGGVWATLSGPHQGNACVQGDQFLHAGEAITLQSGQYMVIEPWHDGKANAPTVYFTWAPAVQSVSVRSPVVASTPSTWLSDVANPARDLVIALRAALTASGRLVLGLAGLARHNPSPNAGLLRMRS